MALSFLALGDSYTIGEAVAVEGRWPHQLAAALRAQGVDLADPQTIATTGWTTDELDAALSLKPKRPADLQVKKALALKQAGRADEARALPDQILGRHPRHPDAKAARDEVDK